MSFIYLTNESRSKLDECFLEDMSAIRTDIPEKQEVGRRGQMVDLGLRRHRAISSESQGVAHVVCVPQKKIGPLTWIFRTLSTGHPEDKRRQVISHALVVRLACGNGGPNH